MHLVPKKHPALRCPYTMQKAHPRQVFSCRFHPDDPEPVSMVAYYSEDGIIFFVPESTLEDLDKTGISLAKKTSGILGAAKSLASRILKDGDD